MTKEEAVNWCLDFKENVIKNFKGEEKYLNALKAMNVAIPALEKQMPVKIVRTPMKTPICPKCERIVATGDYCCYCGQRLLWEKGNADTDN